ncbi:MAG: hypothetical protein M3Q42_07495 [Pseudomonadota bacterium]|nr:hypothetical protein [Pseudomonadota bacterium]
MNATDTHPASEVPPLIFGALALELAGGAAVDRDSLTQAGSGELAALVARDLAGFVADAARLELVLVGAHYDPVEVLRPGWPLHQELHQLSARAPSIDALAGESADATVAGTGRVIAFGTHEGRLPGSLMPAAEFTGGPLRLLPFVLTGDSATLAEVGEVLERELLERGMAGAGTALAAQDAFGVRIEHARYLTVHDLTAMTAMQYEHAGLAALWPVLETALLQPEAEEWLNAPPEPLLHYTQKEARIALFSAQAWHARYATDAPCESPTERERLNRRHQQFEARQRQFAAVLGAHGVAVTFVHCDRDADHREELS